MNVKFHKNCENTGKILKFHVQDVILWNLTFIFFGVVSDLALEKF